MSEIVIRIDAKDLADQELAKAITVLALAMGKAPLAGTTVQVEEVEAPVKSAPRKITKTTKAPEADVEIAEEVEIVEDEIPFEDTSEDARPKVTKEQIRAVLADKKATAGDAKIKALLKKFGGGKLSDVDPDNYPAMLKAAEAL